MILKQDKNKTKHKNSSSSSSGGGDKNKNKNKNKNDAAAADGEVINNDDNRNNNIMALSGSPHFEISLHICIHNIYICKTDIHVAINCNKFFHIINFVAVDGNMYVNFNLKHTHTHTQSWF